MNGAKNRYDAPFRLFRIYWQRFAPLLKRSTMLRFIYAMIWSRDKRTLFIFSHWVRIGIWLIDQVGIVGLEFDERRAFFSLSNGIKFTYLHEISGAGLDVNVYRGDYEPWITKLVLALLPDEAVFFDVGANIGWFSLHVARSVIGSEVHAFEPGSFASQCLRVNVEKNGMTNQIAICQNAVTAQCGTVTFIDDQVGHALNHIDSGEWTTSRRDEVEAVTLDRYCEKNSISRLDLIKCDVEGAELSVLQGGVETIRRFRPGILLEANASWTARFGYHPADIVRFLDSEGYVYRVIGMNGVLRNTGNIETDIDFGENILFLPSSKSFPKEL